MLTLLTAMTRFVAWAAFATVCEDILSFSCTTRYQLTRKSGGDARSDSIEVVVCQGLESLTLPVPSLIRR
jgi:hypothetical protein